MKTVIANPPWITDNKLGFRSNVRWPFMISKREFKLQKQAIYHFPLYQAYAAAILQENGFSVVVLDATAEGLDDKSFIKRLKNESPDIIIMETSTPSFDGDINTAKNIKKEIDTPLAIMGSHASVFHKKIISEIHAVDVVIRGEFEQTILELVKQYSNKQNIENLLGITYRSKSGLVKVNEDRPYIKNLDTLPYPARELYDWKRYHEPVYEALPWITLISSRGCPFKCIYCSWPQTMYGHLYRVRSPENVVDEMEYCLSNYKPGEFFFDDDTFTVDKKRVQKICNLIIEKKLNPIWSCMGRTDTVDEKTLELMAEAGCRRIKFGIETGSPEIMKIIKKGLELSQIHRTIDIARANGIKVHGTFMIGLPGDTKKTVHQTIDLALSLNLDSAQFSIATPFPGTEFFNIAEKKGWLLTKDWQRYDGASGAVVSYPNLSKDEIDTLLSVAWAKLYAKQKDFRAIAIRVINRIKDQGLLKTLSLIKKYFF